MAIIDIDVIKYNPESDDAIAWKFPREDISLGAQLIVNESQEAIFFKDGKVVDTFGPGRHELTTENMPWLRGLVKFSLGGRTPYAAEVWYVNKTVMMCSSGELKTRCLLRSYGTTARLLSMSELMGVGACG